MSERSPDRKGITVEEVQALVQAGRGVAQVRQLYGKQTVAVLPDSRVIFSSLYFENDGRLRQDSYLLNPHDLTDAIVWQRYGEQDGSITSIGADLAEVLLQTTENLIATHGIEADE